MPLYDYKCVACNKVFEIRKGINEPHPECPECKENALEQIHLGAPSTEYKGKGWFKTDGKY